MKTILLILCLALQVGAAQPNTTLFGEPNKKIFTNNRVLNVVDGKPISVIDVAKRMDMLFYRQYPQYANAPEAKFKFYSMYWKNALQELVDKELILADSVESKVEVSNGDIRQEMESMFGPNILINLDTAGLTFEEAWAMVKEDIIMKRMLGGKVNALAVKMVTPQAVRTAYEEYVKNAEKPDQLCYQVISIRGNDSDQCRDVAHSAYKLMSEEGLEGIQEKLDPPEAVSFKISEEFKHTNKEVSKDYIEVLSSLEKGKFSPPVPQKSRTDQSTVYRIFYLKDIVVTKIPPFETVESRLKDKLIEVTIADETQKYLEKLRKHYNVSVTNPRIPEDFQPFSLR